MPPAEVPRSQGEPAVRSVSFVARLAADRVAASEARRLVRKRLDHIVAPCTLDDVLLIVSELVTNAVLHGGHGDVEMQIAFDGCSVTGSVCDEGPGFERRAPAPRAGRIGGRGLALVEQVADGWGVDDEAAHVWFQIADGQAPSLLS